MGQPAKREPVSRASERLKELEELSLDQLRVELHGKREWLKREASRTGLRRPSSPKGYDENGKAKGTAAPLVMKTQSLQMQRVAREIKLYELELHSRGERVKSKRTGNARPAPRSAAPASEAQLAKMKEQGWSLVKVRPKGTALVESAEGKRIVLNQDGTIRRELG